jgi:hypothetical protein
MSYRWNLPRQGFRDFKRTIGGNIADLCRVGKSGSALPTRTPDCAVRSDHSFKASLYSDNGKFRSDLSAARNVNMSECALNQSSLRLTLNHPLCRNLRLAWRHSRGSLLTIGTLGRIRESTPPGRVARSAVLPPERRNEIATNWVKRL